MNVAGPEELKKAREYIDRVIHSEYMNSLRKDNDNRIPLEGKKNIENKELCKLYYLNPDDSSNIEEITLKIFQDICNGYTYEIDVTNEMTWGMMKQISSQIDEDIVKGLFKDDDEDDWIITEPEEEHVVADDKALKDAIDSLINAVKDELIKKEGSSFG